VTRRGVNQGSPIDTNTEWLEADGLGGFASGTTSGVPTRRYHALALAAAAPPSDRFVLVNGFVAWLETPAGRRSLTRHHYAPGITTEAAPRVVAFESEPWPTIRYELEDGLVIAQEILVEKGRPVTLVRFRLETPARGVRLLVRPLLSGRDFHHLHHENGGFGFQPAVNGRRLEWTPYPGVPRIVSLSNGDYSHAPEWYRRFRYAEEAARGLDCDEDLAAPGVLSFDLSEHPAIWLLTSSAPLAPSLEGVDAERYASEAYDREHARRSAFASPLERHADAYFVRRGSGRTLIAGYPWFSDWGRDTFIALRGLALATRRYDIARDILVEWSSLVSDGMLPNRFPDRSDQPAEYNSVDPGSRGERRDDAGRPNGSRTRHPPDCRGLRSRDPLRHRPGQ
jgi:predicted glycogen debranching enzyme